MPISFFDLPRELRDIIYAQVLISPSGYIEPVLLTPSKRLPAAGSNNTSPPRFTLRVVLPSASFSSSGPQDNAVLSLSLARTCRQIHRETHSIFWTRNIFHFATPHRLIATLKDMGQVPSRRITFVSLPFSIALCKSPLPKALRLLASRARHGAFRRLSLDIGRVDLMRIARCKTSAEAKRIADYDALLGILRNGSAGCRFERHIQVETMLRNWRVEKCLDHATIMELHLAWGGRTFCNGELEWDEYVHVGTCAGMP
jgi:hypothetical protein